MKIALFGATGRTGREIIRHALKRECRIVALARDPDSMKEWERAIEIVPGALTEPSVVRRTLAGCEAAISALGTTDRKPNTVLSDMTALIVRELQAEGIARFVCVTSMGVGDSAHQVRGVTMRLIIRTLAKEIWADKMRQERHIAASDLDYLLVRPGGLNDKPFTGAPRILAAHEANTGGSQMISRAAVAELCVRECTAPTYHREAVTVLPPLS